MLDFWEYQYSNIYNIQEYLAEFLVAKALNIDKPHNNDSWTLYDILYRNTRIEVKQTSYYHPWNKNGKCSMQRTFGITKANSNYECKSEANRYERQNDIYVFCLNTGFTAEESYPLDLKNWGFYVVPTSVINEKCDNQKTISLNTIKKLGFIAIKYGDIKFEIDRLIDKKQRCTDN